jgi:hypothetical protein
MIDNVGQGYSIDTSVGGGQLCEVKEIWWEINKDPRLTLVMCLIIVLKFLKFLFSHYLSNYLNSNSFSERVWAGFLLIFVHLLQLRIHSTDFDEILWRDVQ